MALTIFDLDRTLISKDSDFLWGEFLTEIGAVDTKTYKDKNRYFFNEYDKGRLDIYEYLEFCLQPLSLNTMSTLRAWQHDFMQLKINKIFSQKAKDVVDNHKKNKDTLLVITATNSFIARPIVSMYGIDNLLATELEIKNDRYTGKICGEPCFQHNKITHLNRWLEKTKLSMKNSTFYSDSINDLPMLEFVDNPVVINGDEKLKDIARKRKWRSFDWD